MDSRRLVMMMVMMEEVEVVVSLARWSGAGMVRSGCTRCPRVTEDWSLQPRPK